MRIASRLLAGVCLAIALHAPAAAATALISSGVLTGFTNINVNGSFYDVVFQDSLSAAQASPMYGDQSLSHNANHALADALQAAVGNSLLNITDVTGCLIGLCTIYTIYDVNLFDFDAYASSVTPLSATVSEGSVPVTGSLGLTSTAAVWSAAASPPPSPVPEPAGYALTLAGATALLLRAYRQSARR